MKHYFTSESVTEGHPDKLCDYISDSILDECLKQDKNSRVAAETVAGKGEIYVTGEITTAADIDIESIVRNAIKEIGYDNSKTDIDYRTCKITINMSKQSPDIALGVDKSYEAKMSEDKNNKEDSDAIKSEGAGDQGLMFGFACDETENYMPLPIYLAHALSKKLTSVRKNNEIRGLRPDGKVQVTVEYEENTPIRIDAIVVSTQHEADKDIETLRKEIKEKVIMPTIPETLLDSKTKYYINPTGRFVIGGPLGDSGLTGRKIIVDTYGGAARHGGGAFSGKDPTKVDRSASYMARHIAKNIVANGYAKKCEIQIAYSIGVAKPVSIYVNTYGTNTIPEEKIIEKIDKTFDLTPRAIINYLDLQRPIYRQTTNYGHFGKKDLPWEKIINF